VFSNFPHAGRDEKIAWSIPVLFRGVPFVLTYLKFGLRIYPLSPAGNPDVTPELLGRLKRIVHIVDKLVQPFADEQVTQGNVTFANRHSLFRHMYTFLREKAEAAYTAPPPPSEPILRDGQVVGWHSRPMQPEWEGFFFAAPTLDAYFSLLEHTLVLLLPFTEFQIGRDNIVHFITSSWAAKFKRVFDVAVNVEAQNIFHALNTLRRSLRNPLSHGGADEDAQHVLYFHFKGVGALPLSLSRHKHSIHFSIVPIPSKSFTQVCETLDSVDRFLRDGPLALAMRYVEAGLDVAFDAKTLQEYRTAMESEASMNEFIEATEWVVDQADNMDW
jgi:hypothetical protein